MAQKVQVILIDDLDGSVADETVEFGLDGATYTIDLTSDKAESLREALKTYVESGQRVGKAKGAGKGATRGRAQRVNAGYDPVSVRAWAKSKGIEMGDRGRIPAEVIERYHAEGN